MAAASVGVIRTLSLVLGGAYGGAYLYNNVTTDSVRGAAADFLLRERGRSQPDTGSSAGGTGLERLSAQVERLSGEVSRAAGRPVVVYGGPDAASRADPFALAGWSVFAVTVGTAVYYVCVWRGISFKDLLWVSRTAFKTTVDNFNAGLKNVSATVSTIRHDLTEKLRSLECRLENVHSGLSKKIESEVAEVKSCVDGVGRDVEGVQDMLHMVNERMQVLDGKIDTATSGIFALVRVVSGMAPEKLQPDSPFSELRQFAELSAEHAAMHSIDGSSAFRQLPASSTFAAAALEAPANSSKATRAASHRMSLSRVMAPRGPMAPS